MQTITNAKQKHNVTIKQTTIFFKTLICPSCGRKLSANYRLVKGVSKIYHIIIAKNWYTCCSITNLSMNLIDSAVWSLIKADLPSLSKQINEIRWRW
jgi:hypothetical protein